MPMYITTDALILSAVYSGVYYNVRAVDLLILLPYHMCVCVVLLPYRVGPRDEELCTPLKTSLYHVLMAQGFTQYKLV